MENSEYAYAVGLHIETFGVAPIVTGVNFFDRDAIIDGILAAIENGVPYKEPRPKRGVEI